MRKWRRTTILTMVLLAFLAGLGLAPLSGINAGWVWLGIFLSIVTYRRRRGFVACFLFFALCLGWWRGSLIMRQLAAYQPLYERKVRLEAVADNDAVYGDKSQLTFDVSNVRVEQPNETNLPGKIKVAGFSAPMVYRGDVVRVTGKLFKTRGSRQASLSFADIQLVGRSGSPIYSVVRRFDAGMQSALPEPLASFALGLLIGQRTTIPATVNQQLSTVGLTHIVAVSGYNLTILVEAVRRLLGKRSKYQSTVLSLLLIGLFVLLTGLSASIVRAAIVSLLSIGAWYYGRKVRPLLIISLAAALTAGWNPLYLWTDIGWYLSFLAFFGVLIIAPLLAKRLFSAKKIRPLTMVLVESLSAQLMAAPLIMYVFGQVSLIGIVANVLVVPLVPLAMLVSLGAGLGGMLLPTLAGWMAWPAKILLTYMLDIVAGLSRVPHALAQRSLLLWQMLCLYGIVIAICVLVWRKTTKNSKITDKEQLILDEV